MYKNIQELRKALPDLFKAIDALPEVQDNKGTSIKKSEDENHIQVLVNLEYPEYPNKSISSGDSGFIWTLENTRTGISSSFAHVYELEEPEVFVSLLSCKYIDPNCRISKRYEANSKTEFMPTEKDIDSNTYIMKNKDIAKTAIIDLCNKVKNIHKEVIGYTVFKGQQFSLTFDIESTSDSLSLTSETIQLVSLTSNNIHEYAHSIFSQLPEKAGMKEILEVINEGNRAIAISSPSIQYLVSNKDRKDEDTINNKAKVTII